MIRNLKLFTVLTNINSSNGLSIGGTVTDGANGIAGATVALGVYSAVTQADGTYSITGIPAGTSGNLTVTKIGYLFTPISISAMTGNLVSQDFICLWYTCLGITPTHVYQGIGAASLAASKVNLINSGTNDLTATSNPTFDPSYGWSFGAGNFLKTGVIPANTDISILCRLSDVPLDGGNHAALGAYASSTSGLAILPSSFGTRIYRNGADLSIASGNVASGVLGISGNVAYRDGVAESGTIGAGTAPAYELYIGSMNITGSIGAELGGKVQAVIAFVGTNINGAGMALMSARMATLP